MAGPFATKSHEISTKYIDGLYTLDNLQTRHHSDTGRRRPKNRRVHGSGTGIMVRQRTDARKSRTTEDKPKPQSQVCRLLAVVVAGCDAIVSWNFKHIVNPKTAVGVKAVTATEGYPDLMIYAPTFLIGDDSDDS